MDDLKLEKYSSAITLSDMEIFVFPELMYSLVLANIMSPIIWRWRQEPSFKKLEGKSTYRKLLRLRQFIMDQYDFNLDLETWGLTSKEHELKRFENFITTDTIAQSNSLFGYQGDKYYFDVDIRRHFGLDKYDDDVIPYWKTETVEAMDAFRYKKGYTKKAGECVSLSALYAAAAFIVCGVPLEDIYMILTPLHSQNLIDINDGLITNNRRIVTKQMWFNGTAISMKAQRALKNEQVTIVAHSTGCVHCMYDDATIDQNAYKYFAQQLGKFLSIDIDMLIFTNFLKANSKYQKNFQYCRQVRGERKFVKAEVLFHYEHGSKYRVADVTFDKLLGEVSAEDYLPFIYSDRMCCEQLDNFIKAQNPDIKTKKGKEILTDYLSDHVPNAQQLVDDLAIYVHTDAQLPSPDKNYQTNEPIKLSTDQSREEIIEYLRNLRDKNSTADLAFYAYRDIEQNRWEPFVKAALQRNPVSITATDGMTIDQVYQWLTDIPNESIYEGKRLAQPDEVANYLRGDGIEKALLLANIIHHKSNTQKIEITIDNKDVTLNTTTPYHFTSNKNIKKTLTT